jgi:hypothetical protein
MRGGPDHLELLRYDSLDSSRMEFLHLELCIICPAVLFHQSLGLHTLHDSVSSLFVSLSTDSVACGVSVQESISVLYFKMSSAR